MEKGIVSNCRIITGAQTNWREFFHLVAGVRALKTGTGGSDVNYGPETREQVQKHQTDCSIYDKIQLIQPSF